MEDGGGGRSRRYEVGAETNAPPAGLTLGGILSIKQTPPYRIQERTLLDLIRDDPTCGKESKTTWKTFRDKLRLKLAGSVCTSTVPTLASHVPVNTDNHRMQNGSTQQNPNEWQLDSTPVPNTTIPDTQTARVQTDRSVEDHDRIPPEDDRRAGEEGGAEPEVRMSLMSLLEVDGSTYLDDDEEEAEEEQVAEVEEDGGRGEYKYNNCCVCMVRHKGAAFIPCGHTFCRLCSRELFVQRASCPLCNNFILEILDIF